MKYAKQLVFTGIAVLIFSGISQAQYVWTQYLPAPTDRYISTVVWTGTKFLIPVDTVDTNALTKGEVGTHKILSSPDGINWTSTPFDSSWSEHCMINSIAIGNGIIVAVGDNGYPGVHGVIFSSQDGISWTKRYEKDSANIFNLYSVIWTGTQFVAVGYYIGPGNDTALVVTSPDGTNWTKRELNRFYSTFRPVAWTGDNIVTIGYSDKPGNYVATTPDCQTWNYNIIPVLNSGEGASRVIQSLAWAGNQLVAVGYITKPDILSPGYPPPPIYSYCFLSSPDGQVWTQNPPVWGLDDTFATLYSVLWTGSQFVAVGTNATLLISSDFANWTKIDVPISKRYALISIACSDSMFVAVGSVGTIITSPISSTKSISRSSSTNYKNFEISRNLIRYSLPQESPISIKLYNLHGQLIQTLCNSTQPSGTHTEMIPSGIAQGNYILTFSNGLTKINRNIFIGK